MELFLLEEENPFFEQYQFYGIISSVKPARLCWLLQRYLSQEFTRDPETDIPVLNIKKAPKKSKIQSLFDTTPQIKSEKKWSFHALIATHFTSTLSIGYIYQNKVNQSLLIPDLSNFDYIYASPLTNDLDAAFISLLKMVPGIRHVSKIDIFDIKTRDNLLI